MGEFFYWLAWFSLLVRFTFIAEEQPESTGPNHEPLTTITIDGESSNENL